MSITAFLQETRILLENEGLRGIRTIMENFLRGLSVRFGMIRDAFRDETLLNCNWDLLIVLDACRYDLMTEVEDEYSFLDVKDWWSYGSSSQDWIHKTFLFPNVNVLQRIALSAALFREPYQNELIAEYFEPRELQQIAYITWNAQAESLDSESFYHLNDVWQSKWKSEAGLIEPRVLTNETIRFLREEDPAKTIVHYMQPHEPFRESPDTELTAWQRLQRGHVSREELWEEYKDNLRWVLDDVELLLENVDADNVVITADHGNCFGEYGFYGHRPYLPLAGMRRVPWVETTAADEETHVPMERPETNDDQDHEAKEILEDLGYR